MKQTSAPTSQISNTLAIAATKGRLTTAELTAVRNWLSEQLLAQEYAKLGQGGHTQNQVPLRRVFVDLPVTNSLNVVPQDTPQILFLDKLLSSNPLNLKRMFSGIFSTPNIFDEDPLSQRPQASGDRSRLKPTFSATLLIGGPGQGKSTLGQLACQLHRAALLKPLEKELTSSQLGLVRSFEAAASTCNARLIQQKKTLSLPQRPFLPLQIILPDLAAWLAKEQTNQAKDQPPALLRFLADLPSAKTCGLNADNLLALASNMTSLLVLDGFDEIGATQDRERIIIGARELLTVLAQKGAFAQVIATTRPQGYAGELAQIGIPLEECYLAPLLREEALEYARKLVEAKIPDVDQQKKTLARLHEAAEESATQRLLTTPLQVTILTALVQQLGRAPRERWNLFSRYFAYTYDREIERETYASRLLAEHRAHIEQIHARVALLLQVEAERDGGASARMTRARLEEVIAAVLSEDEVSETECKSLVHEIAVAAEHRLVFLVEPEPGSFGFEIRSLQEFMAAWALTSGRDAEVETRLQQVAKAPMFRNVVLFASSRLFSEGSPLRDVLADRVCGNLDDDQDDELSSITRAGGMLALETLEEGAVLSQPKRARALMTRATGLLLLPPGNEHARLARAANSDTAQVLRDAIERGISGDQNKHQISALAAWLCLIEATNHNTRWAMELGDNFWSRLADPDELLIFCFKFGIPLGQWFTTKIEQSAEQFSPEHFVNLRSFASESEISPNWVSWLCVHYNSENLWSQGQLGLGSWNFRFISNSGKLGGKTAPISPAEDPPVSWHAWVAAARYEIEPTAHHLAMALDAIADSLPKSRWSDLKWRSSWPLGSCLAIADTAEDLRRFKELILSGDLGDTEEWLSAQASWEKRPEILAYLDDMLTSLDDLSDYVPWSHESLKHRPPLFAIPLWGLVRRTKKSSANDQRAEILEKANRALQTSRSHSVRVWLADVCMLFIQLLPVKTLRNLLQPVKWVSEASINIEDLVPRPKFIRQTEWLQLLNSNIPPSLGRRFLETEAVFNSLIESNAHPAILRTAVLSLDAFSTMYGATPLQLTAAQFNSTIKILNNLQVSSPIQRADLAILKILLGSIPADSDADLFRDIAIAAVGNSSLWTMFLNGLRLSHLPLPRISALLTKTYIEMGISHPQAHFAILHIRDILQTRKSELDSYTMWNRLALPLPYPQPPLLSRLDGGIPSRPIRLESLELRDIGVLHLLKLSLSIPSDDQGQWVVILGPNGIGKTTLLRSLTLALRNSKDPAIWPKGAFANPWQRISRNGGAIATDSRITVKLGDGVEHVTHLRQNGSSITQFPEQNCPRLFPFFAYGCRRGSALGGAARQVDLTDDDGPEIATLFDEGAALIHAETWLLQLEGDAPKNPRSKAIFDAVIEAIKTLLDLDAIEVSDRKLWVVERARPKIPFSALSDGYLTSAGWFLDLVARWITLAERYKETIDKDFLARMRGLVLIDEIDLHLHPRWQIEIITRTRRLLPQMSFVVTTHNPLTLVGAKAEEIWIMSTEAGRVKAISGVESPMLLTGGQIYRSYFGIDDIYPDGLGRALQRYSFLSGYALRTDTEQAELESLQMRLREAKLDPGWEIVSRTEVETEIPALTATKKSRSRHGKVGE